MVKRLLLTLGVIVSVLGVLGLVKFQQIQSAIEEGASFRPPPEAVTTVVAEQATWPVTLNAIGTVEAVQGVTVSADLPGTIEAIGFDSGGAVGRGQLLVRLDTRQERAQLQAAAAQRDLARVEFERMQGLLDARVVSRAEFDRAAAEHRQTEARVEEIGAAIERKTIRAPFAGVLGIRQVDLGQYLSAGDPVVSLQRLDPIRVNIGVPQQAAGRIRIGRPVRVTSRDLGDATLAGRVTAIDPVVDESTRNVRVQATLSNGGGRLRPGMFVQADVSVGDARRVIALPASAISYAPYGDSVFLVKELKGPDGKPYHGVRQQFVKLDGAIGDQVAVISGIAAGDEVVTSGAFKLRNDVAVLVNNKVQPANDPAPTPENK